MAFKKKSVLIVDDEVEIRDILKTCVLKVAPNALVMEAGNGIDAEAKVKSQLFECIVTDISMPKSDGIDFLYRVAQLRPEQRPKSILILSAYFNPNRLNSLPMPVPIEFLPKPCSITLIKNYFIKVLGEQEELVPAETHQPLQSIPIYLETLIHSFSESCGLKFIQEGPAVCQESHTHWDVSILTSTSSEAEFESIQFGCSQQFLLSVADRFKMKNLDQGKKEPVAIIADLIKSIHEKVKVSLSLSKQKLPLGAPFIVSGKDYHVHRYTSKTSMTYKYNTELGTIEIEFSGI